MNIEQDILAAKVLIVDDQLVNVSLLTRMLEEAGYSNVTSTLDPLKVCALHRGNAYDLILLDLQMPGMDGFAVMEGLKTNPSEAYLPVIVLTAQPAHKLRALNAGAKDFISKPFDLLEVKTRIRNMLEVRVLYRRLQDHNEALEAAVRERTAELMESEARYRSLTELAADWYWEQDEAGAFTKVSGPVIEMLGIRVDTLEGDSMPMALDDASTDGAVGGYGGQGSDGGHGSNGINGIKGIKGINGINGINGSIGSNGALMNRARAEDAGADSVTGPAVHRAGIDAKEDGWDPAERRALRACIRERRPFLDFALHRTLANGSTLHYRVSGQPMFNQASRFVGYRGVGVAMAAPA